MINIIIIICAFILDSAVSNSLFTVMVIPYLYLSFFKPQKKYFLIVGIIGLFYDLVYTNTLILNASIFLLLAYLTKKNYDKTNINPLSIITWSVALIFIYHVLTYLILIVVGYRTFNIYNLYKNIIDSLLPNIIFTILLIVPYTINFIQHHYQYKLYNKKRFYHKYSYKFPIILMLVFLTSLSIFQLLFKII